MEVQHRKSCGGAQFLVAIALLALAFPFSLVAAQPIPSIPSNMPIIFEASAPAGTEGLAVQWFNVASPELGELLIAVAHPAGAGPFPSVLLLHGSHGFAQEYVRLAQDLADGGILAVAACWFRGGGGAGSRFITPISCPQAPPMPHPSSPDAIRTVDALMQVTRTLPDVQPEQSGLFGHSRGAGAALYYLLEKGNVQAVVLNSGGYPPQLSEVVSQVKAPILILHGTADGPEDGGAAVTNITMAREFEAKLRDAGKSVETAYYEGSRHNEIFTNPALYRDEVQRILEFFSRYLH